MFRRDLALLTVFGAAFAASSAWTQEATGYGQLRAGGTGACLAVDGLSTSSRVLLSACGDPTMQAWRFERTDGRVRFGATDLCLHGRGPAQPGAGGSIRLGACDDDGARGWTGTMANNRLTLRHAQLGLCLDPVGKGSIKAGAAVQLATCGDSDQLFGVTKVPPAVSLHAAAGFTGGARAVTSAFDVPTGWPGVSVGSLRVLDTTAAAFDGPNYTGRCRTLSASEAVVSTPVLSLKAGTTCAALGAVEAPPPAESFAVFAADPPASTQPVAADLRLRALGLCLVAAPGGGVTLGDCGTSSSAWTATSLGDLAVTHGPRCLDEGPAGLTTSACRRDAPEIFDLVFRDDVYANIVQRSSGLCVAATGQVATGGAVTLADCDVGDRALWTWGRPTAVAAEPSAGPSALTFTAGGAIWPNGVVPVCWENPDATDMTTRDRVRFAIENEWGAAAAITFTGWETCAAPKEGLLEVRILIIDSPALNNPASFIGPTTVSVQKNFTGPRTNQNMGFAMNDGTYAPTMFLNMTFEHFSQSCQGNDDPDCWVYGNCEPDRSIRCQEYIAVHEFGHALGFEHEHGRDDVPSSCSDQYYQKPDSGDTKLTDYDPDSVMNYCRGYKRYGESYLSVADIRGAARKYGPPTPRAFLWEHADYQGAKERIQDHQAQLAQLGDKVSSISLLNTTAVAMYEHINFGGVCETATADLGSFATSLVGGDEVSSVRVGTTCDGTPGGTPQAIMYLDSGYRGAAVPLWSDELSSLAKRGANDAISSIDLGPDVRVASLYVGGNFEDACLTISADAPSLDLPGFSNDALSSIRLHVTCDGLEDVPTSGLQLWDDANFSGHQVVLGRDIPDLDARAFHDKASSAKLFGATKVAALWEHDNYTGRCYTVTGDVAQLSATLFGNDAADSVWVGRGCDGAATAPVNGVRLYQSAGATGPSVLLSADTPSLAAVGLHDSASSARLEGTTRLAAVYQGADYTGVCDTITGPVDFSSLRIGNDSASSVRVGRDCFGHDTVITRGARVFIDANYGGASVLLPSNVASLGGIGFGDAISSVRLEGGLQAVALYENADYQGRCQSLYADTGSLAGLVVQGDSASAIRVGVDCAGNPSPPQGGVRVFWDSDYRGESMWVTTSLSSVGSHWNDEITSIRFEGTGVSVAALYEDSNYRGDCTTIWGTIQAGGVVSGGTGSLSGSKVGNDEVTSILLGSPCR